MQRFAARSRRKVSVVLLSVMLVGAAWTLLGSGQPAGALGIESLCLATGSSPGAVTFPAVPGFDFTGDAVTGEHHGPLNFANNGVREDPVTGLPWWSNKPFQDVYLDADARPDLQFMFGFRGTTGADPILGETPLDTLFQENFGQPEGPAWPDGVNVFGYDLRVKLPADSWIRAMPQNGHYAADFAAQVELPVGGTTHQYDVHLRIDSLQAFARDPNATFPDDVVFSLVLRPEWLPGANILVDPPIAWHWAFATEVLFDGKAIDDYPALDLGIDVVELKDDPENPQPVGTFLDADLAWDRTPSDFAIGVRQPCLANPGPGTPSAHFASNLPNPTRLGHTADLHVASGLNQGLDYADELRVDGRIRDVPRRIDISQRDDAIDVVRSPDVSPTIDLERFELALDDPNRTGEEPTHLHGRLAGLPAHLRAGLARDASTGELSAVTLDACPQMDRTDPIAGFVPPTAAHVASTGLVEDCVPRAGDPSATHVRDAHLVYQNFLPDGPRGSTQSSYMPRPPDPAREGGMDCSYLPPERGDGPWTLDCQKIDPVERKAFVLAAAQHPHLGQWTNTNVLLVRAGADLSDLSTVRFVVASEARHPSDETRPPDPANAETLGEEHRTSVSVEAGRESLAQVLLHSDRRDALRWSEDNMGMLARAIGTISPLPASIDELSLTSRTRGTLDNKSDDTPAEITWHGGEDMTLHATEVTVQLPGRDAALTPQSALKIEGQAEVSLPGRGTFSILNESNAEGDATSYTLTSPPTLSNPHPIIGVRLAAQVSTITDRNADEAIHLTAAATLHTPLSATLTRNPATGDLVELNAEACPHANNCDNTLAFDAVAGPEQAVPTLESGVTLPVPAAPVSWVTPAVPEPNHITFQSEAATGDHWAAQIRTRDLVGITYRPVADVCIRSASTDPMTAIVQAPDLWANGRLNRLPEETHLRLDPNAGNDGPMLWIDSTSCDTTAPPVEATAPSAGPGTAPPSSAPHLEAQVVVGHGFILNALPVPPPAPPIGDHLRAQIEVQADGSTAVGATVAVRVPEQLLVWEPATNCSDIDDIDDLGDLVGQIFACTHPGWQRESHSLFALRVQSTSYSLGDLGVRAHLVTDDEDWTIEGGVPVVPGSLHLAGRLDRVPRIGWNDAHVDAVGSVPIEDLHVEATNNAGDRLGFTGDAAGTLRDPTPEVEVDLDHVDDELHVTARLRTAEEPNAQPRFPDPHAPHPCPGYLMTPRGPEGFGYVHADIDLAGTGASATDVVIDVTKASDDPRGLDPHSLLVSLSTNRTIDATLQARMVNIVKYHPESNGFEMCMDFDLPFELTLTDTKVARFVNEGTVFAVDSDAGEPTTDVQFQLGERTESGFQAGVPYGYRSLVFDPPFWGDWPTQTGANFWRPIDLLFLEQGTQHFPPGVSDPNDCPDWSGYVDGSSTASTLSSPSVGIPGTVANADGTSSNVSLTRSTFVADLLFDHDIRADMAERDDDWPNCPGDRLYRTLAMGGTPALGLPIGNLDPEPVQSAEFTINQLDAYGSLPGFCSWYGWDSSLANRPDENTGLDLPVAVGADGTQYTIDVSSTSPTEGCRVAVVARHPGGAIRWTREFPGMVLPLQYRDVEWHFRIFPDQHDGSVEVQFRQTIVSGVWSPLAYAGRLDASGNGHIISGVGKNTSVVLRLLVGLERRLAQTEINLTSDCTGTAFSVTAAAPTDVIRAWYMGDGSVIYNRAASINHCYEQFGDYYALVIDYRNGAVISHTRRDIHVPS